MHKLVGWAVLRVPDVYSNVILTLTARDSFTTDFAWLPLISFSGRSCHSSGEMRDLDTWCFSWKDRLEENKPIMIQEPHHH